MAIDPFSITPASSDSASLLASFYVVSGTLPLQSLSYVLRQADKELLSALLAGEYCFVLNSRQMGKSSLSVRTMAKLQEAGVRTVFLDLTKIGGGNVTAEQWYIGLVSETGRALGLRKEFLAYWKENSAYSLVQRYFGALHALALAHNQSRLVLFIDEIDAVKSLPFSTDEFFAAIRECYNRRAQEPEYGQLAFALVGSAAASDLVKDTRASPFNIGKRIELKDFTASEVLPLSEGMRSPNAQSLVARVFYWTNGHPFLTQALCAAVAADAKVQTDKDVDRLVAGMFFEAKARERNVNLADVSNRILSSHLDPEHKEEHRAAILDLYRQVWRGTPKIVDDETNRLVVVLKLSGITTSVQGVLRVRNRIYVHVFDRSWIAQSMPDAELQRQKQAYHAGMMRTSAIAACIVLLMSLLAGYAFTLRGRALDSAALAYKNAQKESLARAEADKNAAQLRTALQKVKSALQIADEARTDARNKANQALWEKRRANRKTQEAQSAAARAKQQQQLADDARHKEALAGKRAKQEADHSSHLFYEATLGQIQLEWENNNVAKVRRLLTEISKHPDRGVEWDYWNNRSASSALAMVQEMKGHTAEIWGVAVSPDGEWIASGSFDQSVRLWNPRTGAPVREQIVPGGAACVAFAPNSRLLAVAARNGGVYLWDIAANKMDQRIYGTNTFSIAFSPDGKTLAATSEENIILHDLVHRNEIFRPTGHTNLIWRLAFTPDGRRLLTASWDHTVRVWDAQNGALLKELVGHTDYVTALAVSPDGKRIVTCSRNGELIVWDAADYQKILAFQAHKVEITCAAFSPDSRRLATGSRDFSVRLWDARNGAPLREIKAHSNDVRGVVFTPEGKNLVTVGDDRAVRLWNLTGDNDVLTLGSEADNQHINDFQFTSYDGSSLATVGLLRMQHWSMETGQPSEPLELWPANLHYSPDGKHAALCQLGMLGVWDVVGHTRRFAVPCPDPTAVTFTADSHRLLVAEGSSHKIHCYDLLTGKESTAISYERKQGELLALSPDGIHSLYRKEPGSLSLDVREILTNHTICTLTGHNAAINKAIYTPDGSRILTASNDRTARIWNAVTGHELAVLKGHNADITTIAISGNGKQIATGGLDHTVRLWTVTPHPNARLQPEERAKEAADLLLASRLRQDLAQASIPLCEEVLAGHTTAEKVGLAWMSSISSEQRVSSLQARREIRSTSMFYNRSAQPLKLFQIGLDNQSRIAATIPPHQAAVTETYGSHTWQVTDESGMTQVALYSAQVSGTVALLDPPVDYTGAGNRYAEAGQWQQARQAFKMAVRQNAGQSFNYHCLAISQLELGDAAGYQATCEAAFAKFGIGGVLWTGHIGPHALKDFSGLLLSIEQHLHNYPDDAAFKVSLPAFLFRSGRYEEAVKLFKPADSMDNGWLYLAMAHWQLGHKEEARRCLVIGEGVVARWNPPQWYLKEQLALELKEARNMISPR